MIKTALDGLDTDDVTELAAVGKRLRAAVVAQPFPADLEADIRSAYQQLSGGEVERSFAVRSSATAEDLPDASFAGQQETFLNVRGIDAILLAIKEVFASLYNDRAIAYRVHHGFEHETVALSAGCSRWSAPTSPPPASCSPWTPSPASPMPCSSPPPTAWARGSCRVRSTRTSSTSTNLACGPGGRRSSNAASAARPPRWCTPTTPPSGAPPNSSTCPPGSGAG